MQDPSEILFRRTAGRLLATHSEARSLLSEADHCRVLADQSAAEVMRRYDVMQAARLGYEELRHRLDPRRARPIHFGVAVALLAALFAVLVVLDIIVFDGILTGWVPATAVAAAAAWIGCAWLAGLALREEQRGRLAVIIAGALALDVLLATLHGDVAAADRWYRFGVGAVAVLLVFVLVTVAAMLIARTEPMSLLIARRRWSASRSAYAAAVRIHRGDAEAEAVARRGWHGLIHAHTSGPGQDKDRPPALPS